MRSITHVVLAIVLSACCGGGHAPSTPPRPVAPAFTSPGPLSSSHGGLACTLCHVGQTKATDANLCLDCHHHRELRDRIAAARGFHASAMVRGRACESCHLEHRGAAYDLMGWQAVPGGRDHFDHDLTGWRLDGAHQGRACSDCHTASDAQGLQRFVGTDRRCVACHPQNPHGFQAGALLACERCHATQTWAPALAQLRFNHDDRADARWPLIGAHAGLRCSACHPDGRFRLALADPARCTNCHPNPHTGPTFAGKPCEACHSPTATSFKAATAP